MLVQWDHLGGAPARNANDLDICYATGPANLEALAAALTELGATLRDVGEEVPFLPDARILSQLPILTLASPDGDLDLLVAPAGAPADERLRSRATRLTLDGIGVLANLEALEAMKRVAGRPVDRIDLEEIQVIRRLMRCNASSPTVVGREPTRFSVGRVWASGFWW